MGRIAEFAAVVKPGSAAVLAGSHPVDSLLLSLLVHTAFADGEVDQTEFDLLGRLMPALSPTERLMQVDQIARSALDLEALLAEFPAPSDRQALVALAKDMARTDRTIDIGEVQLIDMLKTLVDL